jgi:hypothetical protein
MVKKVIKNKPFIDARGQYNFDINTNLGIYPYIDDKFLDKDLYSINQVDEINEAILGTSTTIPLSDISSYFTIDLLSIVNNSVSHYLNNVKFNVYIIDSHKLTIDINDTSYDSIVSALDDLLETSQPASIYFSNHGDENPTWGPGTIIENATIFTGLFDDDHFEYDPNYQVNNTIEDYDYTNVDGSLNKGDDGSGDDVEDGTEIYIIVRMRGDADRWFGTDDRNERIQIFSIPAYEIAATEEEWSYNYEYGDSIVYEDTSGEGAGNDAQAPAFKCDKLNIRAQRKIAEVANPPADFDQNYTTQIDFSNFISMDNYEGIVNARPNRIINWEQTNLGEVEGTNLDFDFYPTSVIKATETIDIQSYYTDGDDRFKASSPIAIDLSFKISKPTTSGELTDYTTSISQQEKIKFKFFVLDWNDIQNKIDNWTFVFNQWITNMDDFINRQQDGLYKFGQLSNHATEVGNWEVDKSLNYTYTTPGLKTIKAIIFSIAEDQDGAQFQPLRWKFVTIRFYLDNAKVLLEDFSDIGGPDFVTLPWPHTTPVISGISQDSQYINSIRNVLASGKLSEIDVLDSSLLLRARDNDELGDYLGYTDFEQARVFNEPYSMAELLMITGSIVDNLEGPCQDSTGLVLSYTDQTTCEANDSDEGDGGVGIWTIVVDGSFYPHTDISGSLTATTSMPDGTVGYWDGETNTFPMESCVGTIFISDNMDQNLRESCIIELNPQELDGDVIRDSAGNGNRGILIGDYKIDKPSKNIPIRRRSEPKISETDSENGAI